MLALGAGCSETGFQCEADVEHGGKKGSYTFYLSDESLETNQKENMQTIAKAGACRRVCTKLHPAGGDSKARKKRDGKLQTCQDECREQDGATVECGKTTRRKTVNLFGH